MESEASKENLHKTSAHLMSVRNNETKQLKELVTAHIVYVLDSTTARRDKTERQNYQKFESGK